MSTHRHLLHELLDEAAAQSPERPAATAAGVTLDYGELDQASRRLAVWLAEEGYRRGQRIVLHAAPTPASLALIFAASRAGLVFTLLHEQTRDAQLTHIIEDCEPSMVLSDRPRLDVPIPDDLRVVPSGQLTELAFSPARATGPLPEPPLPVDPICLIYTSGTTALPKAVVSTHQQVRFSIDAIQSVLRYREDDVVFTPLPLSFDYGLYQLFLATAAHAHCRLGSPGEAGPAVLDALLRTNATVLPAVPSVAHVLAHMLARSAKRPSRLRLLTNTGAAMPEQTLRSLRDALPELTVHLMFGLTECKRATIMPANGDLDRPGSSGKALPGTEVFVIDGDGERLAAGQVGEIVVRGPNVMAGYWHRPELTATRFYRREGLFPELRTGDFGRLDAEGYLYISGRNDDMYKENGFRVSTLEVEAAAMSVSGVDAAAVLAPDAANPARLFVVSGRSAGEILADMRSHIEDFKIPRQCSILDRLPLTRNGKVDRKALAAIGRRH